jgi:hypothetical protein
MTAEDLHRQRGEGIREWRKFPGLVTKGRCVQIELTLMDRQIGFFKIQILRIQGSEVTEVALPEKQIPEGLIPGQPIVRECDNTRHKEPDQSKANEEG